MSRRSQLPRFSALALACALSGPLASCGEQCDRNPDEPAVVYRDGRTNLATNTYASAPIEGPYLDFPPGRTYRFFHGLPGVPQNVDVKMSFAEYPYQGTNHEGTVQAAGNQVTYEDVTSQYIDVRNDTCSDVRIRLFASDPLAVAPDAGTRMDAGN